jgi:hypothetical protein
MKDYKDLKSDAARRLFLDLKIAFWNRASASVEENQRIVRSLRKQYDKQHGEGASERDLGLLPFLSQAESVTKEVEALERVEALEKQEPKKLPVGFESWFQPTSEKKRRFDYLYSLALPALGGEEVLQASIPQADINANLLAECKRLYLIDARTNPKAAEEFAAISSLDDVLTYLSGFPNAFDEGYDENSEFVVAARAKAAENSNKGRNV